MCRTLNMISQSPAKPTHHKLHPDQTLTSVRMNVFKQPESHKESHEGTSYIDCFVIPMVDTTRSVVHHLQFRNQPELCSKVSNAKGKHICNNSCEALIVTSPQVMVLTATEIFLYLYFPYQHSCIPLPPVAGTHNLL